MILVFRLKFKIFISSFLIFITPLLFAKNIDNKYSEDQVKYGFGLLPYSSVYAAISPALILPYDTSKYISGSTLILGGIPSSIVDFNNGISSMGIATGCFASAFFLESFNNPTLDSYVSWPVLNIGQKTQMWSYYDGYQKARMNCINDEYANSIQQKTFNELALSPWNIENIKQPYVWVPVIAASSISFAVQYLGNSDSAIWKTGESYLGQQQVPIPIGILSTVAISLLNNTFTAIGEEAVFRGIGYEEFKLNLGVFPAVMLDSVMFSAMHIPSELQNGESFNTLLLNSSFRMGITIGLDYAYDNGGLEASVAQHMWIDMCLHLINYLFSAGIPRN